MVKNNQDTISGIEVSNNAININKLWEVSTSFVILYYFWLQQYFFQSWKIEFSKNLGGVRVGGCSLLLLNSIIKSQFAYCPLIWMFSSRFLNNALNNIHERALWLIFNHHEKLLDSILTENNLKTIHQEFLAIEI